MKTPEPTFGDDVAYLQAHTEVIVLGTDPGGPRVVICPVFQGRVMTSSARGDAGASYGWINYDLIASGGRQPHINAFGGEERFWMGPEGGQFAIFFKKGDPFDFEHWQTPAFIDSHAYLPAHRDEKSVRFIHDAAVTNYAGTEFKLRIERTIRLLDAAAVKTLLKHEPGAAAMVAYESENTVTNTGDRPWVEDTGLLSIWILCMYKHSPKTTVVIPYLQGPESEFGRIVNDEYFGKVPSERLAIRNGCLFFKADGQCRSKIGVNARRAVPVCGAYDAQRGVLTIVHFNKPTSPDARYVNSMWELQDQPYSGDVVNSYNDGPVEPGGKPLGPFFELESSSPAAALAPGQKITHVHRTFHFEGSAEELDRLARGILGVSLDQVRDALP